MNGLHPLPFEFTLGVVGLFATGGRTFRRGFMVTARDERFPYPLCVVYRAVLPMILKSVDLDDGVGPVVRVLNPNQGTKWQGQEEEIQLVGELSEPSWAVARDGCFGGFSFF